MNKHFKNLKQTL